MENDNPLKHYDPFGGSDWHPDEGVLARFFYEKKMLSNRDFKAIDDHLKTCGSCQAVFENIKSFEKEGNNLTNKASSITWSRYLIAACIVIGIGISSLLISRNTRHQITSNDNLPNVDSDSSSYHKFPEQKKEPVAANKMANQNQIVFFEPNPALEDFIGQTMRSIGDIRDIRPQNGTNVKIPFQIFWRNSDTNSCAVVILNNRNEIMWSKHDLDSTVTVTKPLLPGLYYWKLLKKSSMVFMGKFYINALK